MPFCQQILVKSAGQNVRTSNLLSIQGMGAKLVEGMGAVDIRPNDVAPFFFFINTVKVCFSPSL